VGATAPFADHREGRNDYSMPLVQLLTFEYWARAADRLDSTASA
jgi:hypothetical protein